MNPLNIDNSIIEMNTIETIETISIVPVSTETKTEKKNAKT